MSNTLDQRMPVKGNLKTRMQSAVLQNPRQFDIQERTTPDIGDTEVLVRLSGCGVCGSNIPVWEGRDWFNYPQESGSPGHEGWGAIEAIGANVKYLHVGQPVACLSYHAFATHDVAEASHVVPLPQTLVDTPFPAEPLACAINVLKRCESGLGQDVAIIGIGFLGALLTQLLSARGINVTAISRRRFALETAELCGAKKLIGLEDQNALQNLDDQFSCVIEATGFQQALDLATRLVSCHGQIVIAGYHQDGLRNVNMQSWNWKGINVINAHQRDPLDYIEGMLEAVQAMKDNIIQLDSLITHQFPLEEINEAFEVSAARPHGFMKAIVIHESK